MLKEPDLSALLAIREYGRNFERSVYMCIKEGMYIRNGSLGYYLIDDLAGIYAMLDARKGLDVQSLRRRFTGDTQDVVRQFGKSGTFVEGKPVVRYTRALCSGTGQCLETALAAHLVRQYHPMCRTRSALVTGYIEHDGWTYHSFNFKLKDGKMRILDISCPVQTEHGEEYEFPLHDVTNARLLDDRPGALFVPKRTDNRRYFLPMEWSRNSPYNQLEL